MNYILICFIFSSLSQLHYIVAITFFIIHPIIYKNKNILIFILILLFTTFSNPLSNINNENQKMNMVTVENSLNKNDNFFSFESSVNGTPFLFKIFADGTNVFYGDKIKIHNFTSKKIENKYNNPSSFNFANYSKIKGITNEVTVRQFDHYRNDGFHLVWFLKNFRDSIILKNSQFGQIGKFANSLVLGHKNFDEEERNLFSNVGIIHVLTISGTHINFIVLFINIILSLMGITKKKINYLILIVLPIYAVFAGGSIPVMRAVLIEILYICFSRHKDRYFFLKVSCALLLALNPLNIFSLSFQLSFYIAFIVSNLKVLPVEKNKVIIYSFLIYFLMLPMTINLNYSVNFFSPLINIILVPIFTIILLPFSILFVLGLNFKFFIFIFELIIGFIYIVIYIFDYFTIKVGYVNEIFLLLYFYLVYQLFKKKVLNYLIKIILLVLIILPTYNFFGSISFIDIGQGDATLIQLPFGGKNILIDTGPESSSSELVQFLKFKAIKKIDFVFLTHFHEDHIGGLQDLKKNFKIGQIFGPHYNKKYKVHPLMAGDSFKIDNHVFEVISSNNNEENENNNSLVVQVRLGGFNFLFTGDSEKEIELNLIKKIKKNSVDVLQVGHHGSKTSSTSEFIKHINPKYAVFSFGKNNKFGHPHPSVVKVFQVNNTKVLSTSEFGCIEYKFF